MKQSLGRLFVLLLLSISTSASTYQWTTFVTKTKAYVGEAVHIKYLCQFDDNGELYIIDFEPQSTNLYDFILLTKSEKLVDGKRINSYEYILQPKSSQNIELSLEATMKETSLDSIVENTTNHYDDTKFDSIHKKTVVKMQIISLEVLNPPKKLFGNFNLQVKKDEAHVKAYEPYHLDVTLRGQGNFDVIKDLEFDVNNVKVFTQKPIKEIDLGKDGYKGKWTQKFAFVSAKDFRIPSKKIEYFNTKTQNIEILSIDSIDIKVQKAYKKAELLDVGEDEFLFDFTYGYYFLTLLAGFLVGKINFKAQKISIKNEKFISKVKATKSLDALSMLLILDDEKKFHSILSQIDSAQLYSLKEAKKLTIKLVQ
ncbi:hypothetical protein N9X61_03765 [Sulfurimonas sp.]|nr:hypothetical protein [Sulfurimonas sp.]